MAKNSIADYSATAASNTDIQSVDIDEGCAPSGINNAIRELMADIAGELSPTADAQFAGVNYPAIAGIVESNANFIDTCLVGPSVDGKAWAGKFENGSVWSSLMLATVETSGSDAEVNIWDLTAGALASASPLATVTLTGATPTSIAASMGYVIVGTSDQGFHIVDPHDGAWAERTDGWPRSLTASTTPALTDNNVQFVCAGLAQQSPRDPRTAGPMPCFGVGYGAGADIHSIIKHDGNVYDRSNTVTSGAPCFISNGFFYNVVENSTDRLFRSASPIDAITADDWSYNDALQTDAASANGADTALDIARGWIVGADAAGLIVGLEPSTGADLSGGANRQPNAQITGTYNTGMIPPQAKLVALANSKTVDRSDNANTLTENGTVPSGAVASGAELQGYGPFSDANYLSRAYDADFDPGTGSLTILAWICLTGDVVTGNDYVISREQSGASNARVGIFVDSNERVGAVLHDGTYSASFNGARSLPTDGSWHFVAMVWNATTKVNRMYVDAVYDYQDTQTNMGSLSNGSAIVTVGRQAGNTGGSFDNGKISLVRWAGQALSEEQIGKIYQAEKGMFAANAKCLLQGASNAVLDARVDPLTGKYIVTQSDTQDIFDGLAIESERTIATGGTTFEHGLLWGDGVAEINDANLYASMPATDQRQVNEMVRSMAAELPAGVDLSKAKAWAYFIGNAVTLIAGMNIESVSDDGGSGNYTITLATPFKSANYVAVGSQDSSAFQMGLGATKTASTMSVDVRNDAGTEADPGAIFVVFFGELENE